MNSALLSVTEQLDQVEQNQRILAIDDDVAVLEYYREVFEPTVVKNQAIWDSFIEAVGEDNVKEPQQQYQLETALSGEKGVELARQAVAEHAPFTVAFVDMRMPGGMDGLETAQQLREIDPRIMLVIITAYSDHQLDEIQRRLLRDVLFLNKPISADEATQTVRMLNQNWKDREKNKIMELQMVSHAKMASLGNMAVRIGHEINQPLSYINGMLQLQKMELESGSALDLQQCASEVDLALEQTVRIKEIIDSLRVFAHPDKTQRSVLSLAEAIEHVHRIFRGRFEAHRIRFTSNIEHSLPKLYANASQLQRIFTNLTSNAIDAVLERRQQEGRSWEAMIMVEAHYNAAQCKVEINFSDNGGGIPQGIRDRVFDPFVTTKEPGKGTGLGLSEIHGMLREHGASIEYQPAPESEGARFVILFPIYVEVDDE